MELTLEQVALVGLVAAALAQIIKLLVAKFGKEKISRFWITVAAYVVSCGLAVVWMKPVLPPLDDPAAFVAQLLVVAGAVIGFATLIYNLLLAKLLELIGWTAERVLGK